MGNASHAFAKHGVYANNRKENEFTMSIQIRPRAEYRNGALMPRNEGEEPAGFINNRARLSMEYKRSDLQMKISAQHVGYGDKIRRLTRMDVSS